MARDVADGEIVESRDDLVAWLEAGCKPADAFRIGAEHEKFLFYKADLTPVPYEGPRGVCALLEGMRERLGWERIEDAGKVIGLLDAAGGAALSLEPGGQFELSGAPLATVHEIAAELDAHLHCAHAVADSLGIGFLALGVSPKWSFAETPTMPKSRYHIMSRYMPRVGTRGLDMMYRTATVQTNFDFSDEADMVAKLRVGLALQPVVTALFANSPFTDGALNGLLSARSEIWRHTDGARTGMLPFAFESGMGFERYVDYALDVPLYFVKRDGVYHEVAGASFRDLLAGRLKALPGERATIADWANHLSTIFPEVRLKRYLEMRGADVGPPDRICALAALTVGLAYDRQALAAAGELVRAWSAAERQTLRDEVPRLGLAARIAGRELRAVARETLAIARGGLARRGRKDAKGRDESIYLAPLDQIVADGRVPAQHWIARFNGAWGGRVEPAFGEAAI
ncbi:MAG: glutamate--cysteine ligase [Roseiarcus sp.]|jgi:glutamate--cysteine ligase